LQQELRKAQFIFRKQKTALINIIARNKEQLSTESSSYKEKYFTNYMNFPKRKSKGREKILNLKIKLKKFSTLCVSCTAEIKVKENSNNKRFTVQPKGS